MRPTSRFPTLDEKAWRSSEPHTPHPRKRIEAVAELNRQGIPCGVLIAPLMPGINDSPEQVEEILDLCAEAGAVNIGGICLHLRGEVRDVFMDWLRSYRPDLVPRYERLYARGAYAPKAERDRLSALTRPKRPFGLGPRQDGFSFPRRGRGLHAARSGRGARPRHRSPAAEQGGGTGAGACRGKPVRHSPSSEAHREAVPSARATAPYTASNSPVSTSRSISSSIWSSLSAGISPVSTARRISRSRKRRNLRISSTSTR